MFAILSNPLGVNRTLRTRISTSRGPNLKFVLSFFCFFDEKCDFFKYRATRRPRSSRLACSKALEKTKNSTGMTGAVQSCFESRKSRAENRASGIRSPLLEFEAPGANFKIFADFRRFS